MIAIRLLGDYLYEYPANPSLESLPKDSAVVCLAGGKIRIEAAYSLFADGVGDQLWVIGAGKRSTALGLGRAHADEATEKIPEKRFQKIHVETDSRNTFENADAVAQLLEGNPGVKTIILVTSGYHMRRAQMMIENRVHRNIKIIPYTPPADALHREDWWHSWIGIEVTTVEYAKFLMASVLVPQLGYF